MPLALSLLADESDAVKSVAGDWIVAGMVGYCGRTCFVEALVAPLVSLNLLGVTQ